MCWDVECVKVLSWFCDVENDDDMCIKLLSDANLISGNKVHLILKHQRFRKHNVQQ